MTQMSMNKVIHGAVRRDLDRFVGALSGFPAGDQKRADELATAWDNYDFQLTYHHEGEHRIAWPALESVGVSRELLTTLDREHEAMAAAMGETRTAIASFKRTASAEDAATALNAFTNLRTVTVQHLDHEEAEIEPVYLAKAATPEMKEMGKQFGRDASPKQAGTFFAWLLDGASDAERETLRGSLPGPVLAILTGLFGRRYKRDIASVWAA
ncbi:hemerythrin domain-containing protein [Aeromicrobium sp.]|uniref:hemerythrin domain-containing protein n=1 Tax=Aeromicrobium sp. TaxID=1871063 RepID=UPI003D6C44D0